MAAKAQEKQLLKLLVTTPLPGFSGDFDHFGIDLKGHRLFVAALGNDTVEVLDTAGNRHEKSISGFGEPQGLLYLEDTQRLHVANGSADRVDILDTRSFASVRRWQGVRPQNRSIRYPLRVRRELSRQPHTSRNPLAM